MRILRLLRLLAKFSFADGRKFIRFPDGSVRRADGRFHHISKKDRIRARKKAKENKETRA